ncbi:alpha/beta hydrolase [Adhaeribacter aquaticus]|uniref:alpha/beta hydrolase n=1 Tax=Adhaeribacter aquaticus TaxID=299567 RepID=UPI0004089338|nr:alpha/beta hydrolase [Adhaeribacter aquaticus]
MKVEETLQKILDQYATFEVPPIESLSPGNARNAPTLKNAVEEMNAEHVGNRVINLAKPMPEPVGKVTHVVIPGQGGDILARVYTPKGDGPFTVLVYFHGGGWVIANLDVYEPTCRALCNAAECVVVSVAYRQAPENKFPAAADDAYAALQWVMANTATINGITGCVAVGGESAGGNLATVACLMSKDKGDQMPLFQLLVYPITNYAFDTPSYMENANSKPLNAAMMKWFFRHYLGNEADGNQPYVSPLQAPDISGLPPALVITAELDVLRDEGEQYAQKLQAAGVQTKTVCYPGMVHEFFSLSGVVPTAKEALDEAASGLKAAFEAIPVR